MKKHNLFVVILLTLIASSCGDKKKDENKIFSFDESLLKPQYVADEKINLKITNPEGKEIDSVAYLINDKKIGTAKNENNYIYNLPSQKLGIKNLKALIYSEGKSNEIATSLEIISGIVPKVMQYKIINTYPHDKQAYIEGLEFYKDNLYESTGNGAGNDTGLKGISSIRKVDYKTGKVLQKVEYPEVIFGEGISIIDNKLYHLTYKQNECYVYDVTSFKKLKTLAYPTAMEGWGMTNDGKNLYFNDGTEKIHVVNKETFKEEDIINVYSGSNKIPNVNELEWVNGKIYGNIYQKNFVIVIDPKTGAVEAMLDLSSLEKKRGKTLDVDVLNGIAYNPKTKTFFVTGKNWDTLFEIAIF